MLLQYICLLLCPQIISCTAIRVPSPPPSPSVNIATITIDDSSTSITEHSRLIQALDTDVSLRTNHPPPHKRVLITQFHSVILNNGAANPYDSWHMRLEHVDAFLPIQAAVLSLGNVYISLQSFASNYLGQATAKRNFRVQLGNFEIEFHNRVDEPIPFTLIYYFLRQMNENVQAGVTGVYSGELQNVATGAIVWVAFRLKRGVRNFNQ